MRLKNATRKKTPPWTMENLEVVLKHLKKNISRDPMGYANELFDINVAGDDLKKAIVSLMNRIKIEQTYPEVLEEVDISSIFKNKGSRNDFEFYRGIFRVPILRTVLDRLIYNDEYKNIDDHLSDSNVGARKGRNIRDNIFVLNAITNSVIIDNLFIYIKHKIQTKVRRWKSPFIRSLLAPCHLGAHPSRQQRSCVPCAADCTSAKVVILHLLILLA